MFIILSVDELIVRILTVNQKW